MTSDPKGRELHDRATRGGALTQEEQAYLRAWYAGCDAEEEALLARNAPPTPPSADLLRAELAATLSRVASVSQSIQTLMEENEALRREIASLQQQLKQAKFPQAA